MNFPLLSFRINKEIYKLRFQAYQLPGLCGWAKWQRGSVEQPLALHSWATLWWEPSPLGRVRLPGSSLEHFSSPPQGFRSRFLGERFPALWAQLPWRVERLSSTNITDSMGMNLSAGLSCCTPWGHKELDTISDWTTVSISDWSSFSLSGYSPLCCWGKIQMKPYPLTWERNEKFSCSWLHDACSTHQRCNKNQRTWGLWANVELALSDWDCIWAQLGGIYWNAKYSCFGLKATS